MKEMLDVVRPGVGGPLWAGTGRPCASVHSMTMGDTLGVYVTSQVNVTWSPIDGLMGSVVQLGIVSEGNDVIID